MTEHKKKELTEAQEKLFNAIAEFISVNGFPPTSRELGNLLGITSTSVYEQLERLESKGYIKRKKKTARSIEIISEPYLDKDSPSNVKLIKIPVLGTIAAGQPIFAYENIEEEIYVDESSVGKGRFFALKIRGESMINAGINDGDLVIIRRQPLVEPGEIVAALLEDEATLKRLRISNGRVFLDPENDDFEPIEVTYREDFKILGKLVSTISI